MSRRTLANADRVVVEIPNPKSGTPSRIAVRVPRYGDHAYAKPKFFYTESGTDPNGKSAKVIECTSRRLSRAKRQVRFMHNVRLYRHDGHQYVAV